MRRKIFGNIVIAAAVAFVAAAGAQQPSGQRPGYGSGQSSSQGQRMRGMGGFPSGGNGVLGAVTGVTADHYVIKTDVGETYTVHFSVNTRIMKQPAGRRQPGDGGDRAQGGSQGDQGERSAPQPLKPTDIKVGDIITAGGEVDVAAKSVGAVFILQLDPERAKQMREMRANFGKTWLAGRITSIDGTTITIEGLVDHAPHSIAVDENTSFRERRDSITLADIKPGEQLRAEGAAKDGVFRATQVMAFEPRNPDAAAGPPDSQPKPQ